MAVFAASQKAKNELLKELMPELERIQKKVNEINDQLKGIEKRVSGIQEQLTKIETRMPKPAV